MFENICTYSKLSSHLPQISCAYFIVVWMIISSLIWWYLLCFLCLSQNSNAILAGIEFSFSLSPKNFMKQQRKERSTKLHTYIHTYMYVHKWLMLWQTCKLLSTFHAVLAMWSLFCSRVFIFFQWLFFSPTQTPPPFPPAHSPCGSGLLSRHTRSIDCDDFIFRRPKANESQKCFGFSRFQLDSRQPSSGHRFILFSCPLFHFFDSFSIFGMHMRFSPFHDSLLQRRVDMLIIVIIYV